MTAQYAAPGSQDVAVGGNVIYTDTLLFNSGVYRQPGTGIAIVRFPGVYYVGFSANVLDGSAVAAGTAATLAITANSEPLAAGTATTTLSSATATEHISTGTLVYVPRGCCITIGVRNGGTDTLTITNAGLSIVWANGR